MTTTTARPWAFCSWESCPACGDDLLYQPVEGWDPTTDDGDNDGWTEDEETGETVEQTWRTDLVYDGDPWVCADPTCRAKGAWNADEGIALVGDPHETLEADAHAQILATVEAPELAPELAPDGDVPRPS